MKFVLLLLFSPFVACSFTSLCPQQPNNVVVNCNNANPFAPPPILLPANPGFPGTIIPGRGRVLDIGYNKPPIGSKLEMQVQRSDSSEESSESDESSGSSEETYDHHIPLTLVSRPQIPSFYPTTAVDNKLDFMRRGMAGGFRNNLRSLPRNHIPGHITSTSETKKPDETHGHGHSGQYNHAVGHEQGHKHSSEEHGHGHGHGYEHGHGHEHGHHHGHEHMHDYIMNDPLPSHIIIPTHITHPSTTISGAHIIPEHVVPIAQILDDGTGDIVVNNQGHLTFDRKDPRIDGPTLQVSGIHPISNSMSGLDLLHDTHDRLILTRRGYRALENVIATRGTYELYPQDLLNRVFTTASIPRVVQDGLNTEINCDPIPIVSEIPQAQGTAGQQIPLTSSDPLATLEVQGVSNTHLPDAGVSTVVTSEISADETLIPQAHSESTVTKVTTTTIEERPVTTDVRIPVEETITHSGTEQTGSTVTKVTTTKVSERPAVETIVHGMPTQSSSTVTKVTTTKVSERPAVETIVHGTPLQTGSTVTKVTTTKVQERPTETIVHEAPVQTSSTVTKVTTTTVEERPSTDVISETIVHGTPVQTGSTTTKVTTTKVEERPTIPAVETIVHEMPVQTSSTITKVTTTTTDNRPITSNVETMLPETVDVISEINGEKGAETLVPSLPVVSDVVEDSADVVTTPLLKLVRPARDETYRYDSYRQRAGPLVYHV